MSALTHTRASNPAPAASVHTTCCIPRLRSPKTAVVSGAALAHPTPPSRHTLVFDFDGVLANSLEVTLEIIAAIARDQGVPAVSAEEYHSLTMQQLKKRLNVRFYQVWGLIRRGRAYAHQERARMRRHEEIMPALHWAQAKGYDLVVLSSNSAPTIAAFLANRIPEIHFSEIIGNVGMYAKQKELRKLLQRRNLAASQVMYIGDEVRDVQAAKKVGIACSAVMWGKDRPELLAAAAPTWQVADGRGLIDAFDACLPVPEKFNPDGAAACLVPPRPFP